MQILGLLLAASCLGGGKEEARGRARDVLATTRDEGERDADSSKTDPTDTGRTGSQRASASGAVEPASKRPEMHSARVTGHSTRASGIFVVRRDVKSGETRDV